VVILNDTKFRVAPIPGRLNFPGHSLTLIVKGTFDLVPGGVLTPVDDQPHLSGDVPYADDEEGVRPPRYAHDFAPTKPGADLMLAGHCRAPGGMPTPVCRVTFAVGDHARSLIVMGERRWRWSLLGRRPSEPEPFTKMELRYERAYGGKGNADNPVGAGRGKRPDPGGRRVRMVPNIHPATDEPGAPWPGGPAGFGPIPLDWPLRRRKMGSFNKQWLKTRWPWYPANLDPTHFNAAPPAMQPGRYLRGDEPLLLRHLDAEHAELRTRLPGLRVRCFLNYAPAGAQGQAASDDAHARLHGNFVEVPMNLDTLWVDADARRATLVWRGGAEVRDEEFTDARHWFVTAEPLGEPPVPAETYRRRFLVLAAPAEEVEAPEGDPVSSPEAEVEAPVTLPPPADARAAADRAELDAELAKQGHDERTRTRLIAMLDQPEERIVADLRAQVRHDKAAAGLDPVKPPKLTPAQHARKLEIMRSWGLSDHLIRFALAAEQDADKAAAEESARIAAEDAANTSAAEKPSAGLTREEVAARAAAGEPLDGLKLAGLDLSGLDLSGASLRGADLSGARLEGTRLVGTILADVDMSGVNGTRADLSGVSAGGARFVNAKLPGARLTDADLAGADLTAADLSGATMDGADCEGAMLTSAVLRGAHAHRTSFVKSSLDAAVLAEASLVGADFTDATMARADFSSANAAEARFSGVRAPGLDMTGATITGLRASGASDLTGACFRGAKGKGSIWDGAMLAGADFRGAELERANFTKARADRTDFSHGRLRFARFLGASLADAKIRNADFFEGSMEKADLSRADLGGSNMYGAEFLDATLRQTVVGGTNLKMTKLAEQAKGV
jgi:uncharacterized protein YjbI with pentapeptide repeats